MKHRIRVLITGDEVSLVQKLGNSLALAGCLCRLEPGRELALDVEECDVVVAAFHALGECEFALLRGLKALRPALPVIVGTATGSSAETIGAMRRSAHQCLALPDVEDELVGVVLQAWADSQKYNKTTSRPPRMGTSIVNGELESASPVMCELIESVALAARSNAPVLILGESGTGKERVARAIHGGGSRASQPFVAVNASAIPEALLESEVFGHVQGAFTGATRARRGLLSEANGGTILLDEIGDLPVPLQPKLLRVLQFGETRPVGSDRFGHVDVRVIAATHRDLPALVRDGRFREDLWFRLNVITLVVPSLRNRRNDIAPMALRFLAEARVRTPTSPVRCVSDEAMSVLEQAAWPGNVRELENVIERLVVLGRDVEIAACDLGFLDTGAAKDTWSAANDVPLTLKEMSRRYLDAVLLKTGGDKVRAAGILNINLSTLYRWMRTRE